MTHSDLAHMSQADLIDLVLAQAEQNAKLQAEIEVLRLKLEKGKKPPTDSGNSSPPPSRAQKGNWAPKRQRQKHGPPDGHTQFERKFVSQPDPVVERKPEGWAQCRTN